MSSDALDTDVDLDLVVDRDHVGEVGISCSAELLAFTNAAHCGAPDLTAARTTLVDKVGPKGLREAAATIAAFNGLVRVADGTGIQLDSGLNEFSVDDRERLGINEFAGSANTSASGTPQIEIDSIGDLFG